MSLKIHGVKNAGEVGKEKLIIKVTADCNLINFMVIDCTYDDEGQSSNKHRHVYMFPEKEVNVGEYIILYTGSGTDRTGVWNRDNDTVTHRFYWGLDTTVWNEDGDEALILKYGVVDRKSFEE
ncbi:hypothetical protein [Klebsiella pneumoniae]|uniref:hypothetical protein n=1 Tax=Klebsiella pneumoniae TaxID=573 RepID=UPI00237D3586|nr:hypothetical protein [Klebsiella pneumoniae]MDE1645497.1 hypothetical protein [Klebsiella pneumoniae]